VLLAPFQQLPDGSDLPARVCQHRLGILSDCVNYNTERTFVYQASIPAPTAGESPRMAQNAVLDNPSVWRVFFTSSPKQVSHWLYVSTISLGADGTASGSSGQGLDASMGLKISRQCGLGNCVGCGTLSVQLLCYSAQQCQVARCIGSTVNINRPLCAIGMTLQATVHQYMSLSQGAWLVIGDAMTHVLDATGGIAQSTTVAWPDQAFYGYLCSSKDVLATTVSVLMSSVGGVMQAASQIPIQQAANQAPEIDTQANAIFTMNLAAVTNFLFQLSLAPLYMLATAQKTALCQVNNLISLVDSKGGSITIGDPKIQSASSSALGHCLSSFATENAQGGGTGVASNTKSLADSSLQNMETVALNMALEPLIHPIDGTFTWLSGAVSGLQDVVQTADRAHCKLPDASVSDSFRCACGDWAFSIIPQRSQESWEAQAHWCSGTLEVLGYDGAKRTVYNPYSLDQIREKMRSPPSGLALQSFLDCVAKGAGSCAPPQDPVFARQQVSLSTIASNRIQLDSVALLAINRFF
jgi:hypothetical protein